MQIYLWPIAAGRRKTYAKKRDGTSGPVIAKAAGAWRPRDGRLPGF
jgi:hypothetical protein